MFLRRVNGLGQQVIDTKDIYVPILVPRNEGTPAVTGANSLLTATGITALGAAAGWLLKGPKTGGGGGAKKKPAPRRKRR